MNKEVIKMDMYQKREMRKNKKMNEDKKSLQSTNINWYPGHMAKTKRQITEDMKLVDVVIELLDARIPVSSQNPDISRLVNNKKRIVILNKADLADPVETKKWIEYFKTKNIVALEVDSNQGKGINQVNQTIEKLMAEEGLKKTKNKLIHIGCPIPFEIEEFLVELDGLLEAAYKNKEDMRERVAKVVKTYQLEKKEKKTEETVA